jgi:hypothetical protein
MSISDRLHDAEVLWSAGRREGALLNVLIAVSAAARLEHPSLGDGAAFRAYLAARHTWSIGIEHRGQILSTDQLIWKWMRCELAHNASLPIDVQLHEPDGSPDTMSIRAGGAPDYCVLMSTGWYWWLRGLIEK